ncbi:MAG: cupredoxin domain-containing protein [Nitrospirae bacterium]|nr:cupredoxin domain-containing protein [Nitrospirota bacterium]
MKMRAGGIVWPAVLLSILVGRGIGATEEVPPDEVVVSIVPDAALRCENAFNPSVVTIKAGTTVVWVNQDRETHTLVSSEGKEPCDQKESPPRMRVIDVGQLPHLHKYRQTFTTPGEYPYTCHLPFHHMAGKIIVVP